jgi:hypothetical protein
MRGQDGISNQGVVRIDLSFRQFSLDKPVTRARDGRVLVPWIDFATETIQPNYHAETPSDHTLVALDISYGITPRLTVTAALPFVSRSFGFQHAAAPPGTPGGHGHGAFDPSGEPLEERYEARGFGDLQPGVRYALHVGPKTRLVAGLAVRIPTGQHRLSEAPVGIFHPSFQPGTGSWGSLGSLQCSHQEEGLGLSLSASYLKSFVNRLSYTPGDEAIVAAGVSYRLGKRVTSSAQVKLNRLMRSLYQDEGVSSTGSTFVYITPGIKVDVIPGGSVYALVPLPIFRAVGEQQFVPQVMFLAGIAKEF